ncbi:Twin-arginine translocation pathway signal (plasmid) [Streptomyces albidoflavus]|uniref:Twin-arginine translocation pathway signal n=2 Tax=Streptomyces albidoflavus TaxID=1886 RepID=UPI002F91767B|nr:Twin-arginine translocation pathway signal [Streptomyces albidoflavus]
MATITRARRAEIQRESLRIRMRCQRERHTVERTVTEIRTALPEVTRLEAWRLALGWSRAETIEQIANLYRGDRLRPRALTDARLCRWEHDPGEWPDAEYTVMLCRVYGARPEQLGLGERRPALSRYRYRQFHLDPTDGHSPHDQEAPMTTDAGLPAVGESVRLALLAHPDGGALVVDLAEAAVEHYATNYSKHPAALLFEQVREVRQLLTPVMESRAHADAVKRQVGWLSALMGNLAYHLGDSSGARAHLGTAAAYGSRCGDSRLEAWAWGAQSMVARSSGRLADAVAFAEQGAALAPSGLVRAQLHAWALLPALAVSGRGEDADLALATAMTELEGATQAQAPGRFGFDEAELALHRAESYLVLDRGAEGRACAESSVAACLPGTPGWAAASLILAQAEVRDAPQDAEQRGHDVLERVPAARLRSTARARLQQLDARLTARGATSRGLTERLHALPAPIDAHGRATS